MVRVIAVDFDGCICTNDYPNIGTPDRYIIERLIVEKLKGTKLILWTCREGNELNAAVKACLDWGLAFDAINDNVPELVTQYGTNPRKVSATEYWDDKSVRIMAFHSM